MLPVDQCPGPAASSAPDVSTSSASANGPAGRSTTDGPQRPVTAGSSSIRRRAGGIPSRGDGRCPVPLRAVTSSVRVGVLGCGNVGAALVGLLTSEADAIEARTGLRLEVARVAVRNVSKERPVDVADGVFTNDAAAVVNDPDIDVVVEVIGGI